MLSFVPPEVRTLLPADDMQALALIAAVIVAAILVLRIGVQLFRLICNKYISLSFIALFSLLIALLPPHDRSLKLS